MTPPKPKLPSKRKIIGVILILAGLAMFLVPSLSPASILMETKELHASPNQLVTVRYGYTNEGTAQAEYVTGITRDKIAIVGSQKFTLQPATIFIGIVDFYAPPAAGTYTYIISVWSNKEKRLEEQSFTLVVT